MPVMEAITLPVDQSCQAFCLSVYGLVGGESGALTKDAWMQTTTKMTTARARLETCGLGSPRGFLADQLGQRGRSKSSSPGKEAENRRDEEDATETTKEVPEEPASQLDER